ncbi:MAG: nucleoside triphosphate pyrophosphatase [Thiomicrorhabdus sp.]|nr:nucleoside triphosphate pyrophosphatase [Thiomicrorhabdus sp.]
MFLLASSSAYRLAQLKQLGIYPDCRAPEINETPYPNEAPQALAERLAAAKAQKVSNEITVNNYRFIIGSDQVAACDSQIMGKPLTDERAHAQLESCSGKQVSFFTAVCLLDLNNDTGLSYCDHTIVNFRDLTEQEIHQYISIESPLNCAGSFKCEGLGISLFKSITTKDPSALIGLPLIGLNSLLLQAGYNSILQHQQ